MRKIVLLVLTVFIFFATSAQDFSNKGKEFWLAYSYHVGMSGGGNPAMTLYLTSDVTTTYTVEIYGVAPLATGTINANAVVAVPIPGTAFWINGDGLFTNRTIHVTAAKPIVVYSFITRNQASAATLALPTLVLGKEYYASSFTQVSNENSSNSYITIIAVQDNTTIEIKVTAPTVGGWPAGSLNTITLNKGEIYQVLGTTSGTNGVDLSGTYIKSVSGPTGGCKPIAVFSGSGKVVLGAPAVFPAPACAGTSADNLYQQLYPVSSWGKKFLTVPSAGKPYNHYRIMRSDPATNVFVNGVAIPAVSFVNNYYQFFNNIPNYIEADLPIAVAQYFTSQGCPNNLAPGGGNPSPYDPDMVILSPIEQSINNVTLVNSPLTVAGAHQHNLHLIMKNTGTGITSFTFDGIPQNPANWIVHPQNPTYSYFLAAGIAAGNHTLRSDSGFNAIAYGYGNAETYAYNAGSNVKDLYQQIGVQTQYGIEQSPSVCTGSSFKFKVSLPYCADSIAWDLSQLPGPPVPTFDTIRYTSCAVGPNGPDSTTIVNGKTLYWYSYPTLFNFVTVGTYDVNMTTWTSSAGPCGSENEISFSLTVSDPPPPDFSWTIGGCIAEPVQFTEATLQTPKPTYSFYWNFGDPASGANNISTLRNPTHVFSAVGTYEVKYVGITTPGCITDTAKHFITVSAPLPSATISGTTAVCLNAAQPNITFTATDGTAPYTFSYHINAGPIQTISTVTGNSVTLAVPTNVAGVFTYYLDSVKNTGSTLCTSQQTGSAVVTVNPLPTAAISGTTTVCLNGPSPNVTFTGAAGTAPYTFSYTINGGPVQTVTTVAGNSVTVAAPTNVAGTFTYSLVSVQESSSGLCNQPQNGSTVITVNPLPTASISGTIAVCLNAPSPNITFTGAVGTAPYTFTYTINGGPNQVITTVAGNSVTVAVPTNVAGTFTYALVSVREGSANTCIQNQTGSAVVTVNPLPTASIAGNTIVCLNAPSPNITFTGAAGTAPYTFSYTINGGPVQIVTTAVGNSVTVPVPTNIAGTFTYTLISVQDGSSTACNQAQGGTAVVTVNPLPTASVSGTIAVCQNAASPNITFTGAVGTAPYTFSYTINGGPIQTVTTVVGNSVTVAVPTTVAGTFTYTLVSVQEGSANTCSQLQTGSAIVTVNPLPTAAISGTTAVCLNAASPNITFTGAVGTAPYTFSYRINGGPILTVTTIVGNSVTVAAPTNVLGTFTYTLVSVQDGSSTTCSQLQNGSAIVTVNDLPTASIAGTTAVCVNAASPNITFTGANTTAPYTFSYRINGGPILTVTTVVGNSVTVAVPTTVAGVFTYTLVSVQDGSATTCSQLQTGSAIVTVNPLPTASIAGTTAVCLNAPSPNITLTGASGTAPYTFTYTINGGPNQVITTVAGNSITVAVPTNVVGVFTYALVSVQDASSTLCNQAQAGSAVVTVNPLPTAGIAGTTTVCQNAASPNITFTGAAGTAPYTFSYTINGGPVQTVTTVVGNSVTVAVPTGTVGTFTYTLVSVQDGSSTTCSQAQGGTAVVTINPLPTASVSGTIAVCQNAASPNITFTGANTVAPYTFRYTINGGPIQTVTTVVGNSVTVSVPTAVPGVFVYALVSVQDGSATTCIQNQTGSATVTVNPLPTAAISGTTAVCLNAVSPNITFTGATGSAPYTFSYRINGGPILTVTTIVGNSVTVAAPTNTLGTFTYTLVSVQDGSSTTCSQLQNGSAIITVNDLPTASIAGTTAVCVNAASPNITFTGANTTAPYTFRYTINGGPIQTVTTVVGNSVTVAVPTTVAGVFTYALVSVQDGSTSACSQNQTGSAIVTVNPLPTASISGTTAVCLNAASPNITLTGAAGTAPYTFTYTINGGPNQVITTVAGNSITIPVPTNVVGVFTYALVNVRDASSTLCIQAQTGNAVVTVNPLPTANITGTTTVCQNAAPPNITFTGANATAPYTFSYTINGGPVQTVTTVTGNSVTVAAPTGTVGTFTYTLVSVRDGSSTACLQNQAGSAVVTVNPLPTASISGTIAVCQNAASPNITFTGANTVAPYTFSYTINGGPVQTVTTVVGNSVTVAVPTATVGTFTYALVSVQDGTATACIQNQTGSAIVTVNPLPTGAIAGNRLICINSPSPDITFTAAGGTAPYTFSYRINGGPILTVTTVAGNSVTVAVPTNVAGTFTYTLVSVQDGSSTACSQAQTGNAVIDISDIFPVPNFSFGGAVCIPNALVLFQNLSTIASGPPNTMTYLWNFGDGPLTSTAFNASHQYTAVGPFNVSLQATSNAGCVTTTTIPINNIHPQPKADFSFDKPAGICIGDDVTLTDLSNGMDGIIDQWHWDLGDGSIRTTNPVTYKYTDTITFNVTLYTINTLGCNSDTITKQFTVYPYPKVNAGPDRVILEGGQITLESVTYGNDLKFEWTPNLYLINNTVARAVVNKPLTDMTYTLEVTARGGCKLTDEVFVKLLKFPVIPNTFTPNNDGINDTWRIDYLNTYPDNRVQIFTRTGQLVFESKGYNKPWDGTVKGKPLPFDTYYYIIEPGNGRDPITGYVTIIK